jgi:N-formylglutamate deformylase
MSHNVIYPTAPAVPIVLSVPHCGTDFPTELKDEFKNEMLSSLDDTDWFVDRLYEFATSLGITVIHAVYSRWVIDLNRDPESKPLYTDGRIITGLCPTTDFFGHSIYKDERNEVTAAEVQRRLALYYRPYHRKIQELLDDLRLQFGQVLLWDCHSIRQIVPSIYREKFPDLILGDADGTSAAPILIEEVLSILRSGAYSVSHNYPFKGGYITRHFGQPAIQQHALQLEMTKVNYMDDDEVNFHTDRANRMSALLTQVFEKLIARLNAK